MFRARLWLRPFCCNAITAPAAGSLRQLPRPCGAQSFESRGQREMPRCGRVARAYASIDPLRLFCFVLINKAGKMPVINVCEE